MKKFLTFLAAIAQTVCVMSQVQIIDAEWVSYKDGDVMSIFIDPDWMYFESPTLVNTTNAPVSVYLELNLRDLPEKTTLSDCFSGNVCANYDKVGTYTTVVKTIPAYKYLQTMIEWNCWVDEIFDFVEGVCVVDFTLYVNGVKDKTVTVGYINGDITKVESPTKDAHTAMQRGTFSLDGKHLDAQMKGLVVRDGRKILVR